MEKERKTEKSFTIKTLWALILLAGPLEADEQIIQKEQMSFEKCLSVIEVSSDKLSIAPEISKETNKKRIAIFTLSDGLLKITCDGDQESILVSTIFN